MISLRMGLFLIIVVLLFMAADSFISKTKNSKTNLCILSTKNISTKKYTLDTKKSLHFPLLSSYNDDSDELEFSKSPLDQFLHVLQDSIINESLLKLTLSENDSSGGSDEDGDGLISTIDMKVIEEWQAISGRLIKIKSATKQLQLNCYKDKRMQKSDNTETYTTSEEAVEVVKLYITKAFKKAMLSTKESDFEFKMRKGQGKFRSTSKVS